MFFIAQRDKNEEFSYGIGKDWREKLQLLGDTIKIRNKPEDKRYQFLAYFEHYERATHSEKLSLLFKKMHDKEESPDEYLKRIEKYKIELSQGVGTNLINWKFIFGNEIQIKNLFNSLNSNDNLSELFSTSNVYIIDKEGNLRGRDDDEDNLNGRMFGYNSSSVAEINNKMVDDFQLSYPRKLT